MLSARMWPVFAFVDVIDQVRHCEFVCNGAHPYEVTTRGQLTALGHNHIGHTV